MSLEDKIDAKDLKQMLIGSLSVTGVYLLKKETTLVENAMIFFAITVLIAFMRVFLKKRRRLPTAGGNILSHIVYAYVAALIMSFIIGGLILHYPFSVVTGVALIALPSTLLLDALGG